MQIANCTFNSAIASSFPYTLPAVCTCIGCGYPPLSVRAVAKKLSATLKIPALGLFDYNVSLTF